MRAGLFGSLRGRRQGRRMFAFRVGWIEVVCAVCVPHARERSHPRCASRWDAFRRAEDGVDSGSVQNRALRPDWGSGVELRSLFR